MSEADGLICVYLLNGKGGGLEAGYVEMGKPNKRPNRQALPMKKEARQ
ncbi:MAG: hypothetical protein JSU72_19670 [Deltaproteobacteria bacterium]|nr:MAG: hypothetical protein JSU72_19670 [Deltaproteobacteria bacterium]